MDSSQNIPFNGSNMLKSISSSLQSFRSEDGESSLFSDDLNGSQLCNQNTPLAVPLSPLNSLDFTYILDFIFPFNYVFYYQLDKEEENRVLDAQIL
jgi:hypothetical protein